jgi:hypothetical protein
MRSDHTAPLVTKPQWSALLHQGRHACPDAKRTGLSHKGRTKKGARLIKGRTLIINGGNLRGHVKADICIGPFVSALRIARAEQEIVAR